MAAPTYAINPTHSHIYSHALEINSPTTNPLAVPANAIWIPVGASAVVHFDAPGATGITFTPSAVDLFLSARVSRVSSVTGNIVLFW